MVLRRQMTTEQPNGGERHRTRREHVEDHGKASAGSGRLYPIAGRVFGEPKGLGAVTEERPVALGRIECRSSIEFSQVGDELDQCLSLLAGERKDAGQQILIRESRRHSEDVRIHSPYVSL